MAARVPYDGIPQVTPQGPPGVRVSPSAPEGAFGGGQAANEVFGQARGLAGDIARQQEEVRQKADLAAVFRATADLSNYTNDVQYNPQTGIVAQKGENAFPLAKSVPDAYRKKVSELMGSLKSPEQREVFQRHADQNWNHLNGFNQRHISGQLEQYATQQADAYVVARQNAGANAGASLDFAGVEAAAKDVDQARRAWALKNGVSPDEANLKILHDTSRVYSGAIVSMLDAKQDQAAQKFFAENSDKMTPEDRHRLAGPLKLGSILGEAQRTVDSYFDGTIERVPTGGNNWVEKRGEPVKTMADVIAKSKGIENPEVRAEVERLARQRFADIKNAEKQQNDNVFMAIAKRIEEHPGIDPRGLATPDEWENQLTDPDLKTALKRLAFPKEEQDRLALTNLVLTPDKELAAYSDAQVLARYGAHMYEKAISRRNDIRKGGPAYDAVAAHDATLMSVFLKSGLGGVKPSDTAEDIKKSDTKQEALYKFWDTVDKARAADQRVTGKKADDETTRKKAQEAVLMLQKKINLLSEPTFRGREADAKGKLYVGAGLGRSSEEKALGDLKDSDLNDQIVEMPRDFAQSLFNFAKARPNTMPQGMNFVDWMAKDRGNINRAYLAFLAGAAPEEVRGIYLKGK